MQAKAKNEVDLEVLREGLDELDKLGHGSLGVGVVVAVRPNEKNEVIVEDIEPLGIVFREDYEDLNEEEKEKLKEVSKELVEKVVSNIPASLYLSALLEFVEASKEGRDELYLLEVNTPPVGFIIGLMGVENNEDDEVTRFTFLITRESIINRLHDGMSEEIANDNKTENEREVKESTDSDASSDYMSDSSNSGN